MKKFCFFFLPAALLFSCDPVINAFVSENREELTNRFTFNRENEDIMMNK